MTPEELADAQAAWDAWPDDGSQCAIGDKPPRPTATDHVPEGMTEAEFEARGTPRTPPVIGEG